MIKKNAGRDEMHYHAPVKKMGRRSGEMNA
jgi:hypothetical protein